MEAEAELRLDLAEALWDDLLGDTAAALREIEAAAVLRRT